MCVCVCVCKLPCTRTPLTLSSKSLKPKETELPPTEATSPSHHSPHLRVAPGCTPGALGFLHIHIPNQGPVLRPRGPLGGDEGRSEWACLWRRDLCGGLCRNQGQEGNSRQTPGCTRHTQSQGLLGLGQKATVARPTSSLSLLFFFCVHAFTHTKMKGKRVQERYIHLNAEFQKLTRREKKPS